MIFREEKLLYVLEHSIFCFKTQFNTYMYVFTTLSFVFG